MGFDQAVREADERSRFFVAAEFVPSEKPLRGVCPLPGKMRRRTFSVRAAAAATRMRTGTSQAITEEWDRGGAFLLLPVLLAAGAITYFSALREPDFSAILLGLCAMAAFVALARNRLVLKPVLTAFLVFLLGMAVGKMETLRMSTQMLGSPVTTQITGTVKSLERQAGGRVRITIDVVSTARPKLRYQPDRVRVTARHVPPDIRPGDSIGGLVRLFPPRGPLIREGYDFGFESYFDGIGANGFFLGDPKPVHKIARTGFTTRLGAFSERLRLEMGARIREVLPGERGEIAIALIVGMKRGISEETNESLRRTGLAHILSISGLHMALAAGTIMGILRAAFAFFPVFSARYPVRKYAAGAALFAGLAYLQISGAGVATQRSFIMLAIMLAALAFDRAAITMRNLAIAAIVMIAIAPHEVAGPSFQMSFAATAALVAAYGAWTEHRSIRAGRRDHHDASALRRAFTIPARFVTGLVVTSLVAGIATAIFAAFHFHRIAPLGLPANLAAMPVVSLLVMPPAVIAVLMMPFDLDGPALMVMGAGISMVTGIAHWFAMRTSGDVIGLVPAVAVLFMTVTLVICVVATTRLRLAAIPFAAASVLILAGRDLPDVLVSEDAELVAIAGGNGNLSVNLSRPNNFVVEDWQKALMAQQWHGPVTRHGKSQAGGNSRFTCNEDLCIATAPTGAVVAHVATARGLEKACASAQVVVVADATVKNACAKGQATVISARSLALYGAASVYLKRDTGSAWAVRAAKGMTGETAGQDKRTHYRVTVRHALDSVERPWHRHRIYSRAARGLAERQ